MIVAKTTTALLVVTHDHVDAELLRTGNLSMAAGPTVGSHQHFRPVSRQLLDSGCIEPIPLVNPVRNIEHGVHPDFTQEEHKLGAARHPINIIISPYAHLLALIFGAQ